MNDQTNPLYIFDLDGTLALVDHRRHLAEANKWDDFYRECINDLPNKDVIKIFRAFEQMEFDLFIFSGRSDLVKGLTQAWLWEHVGLSHARSLSILKMREHGDYTPDEILKSRWHDELSEKDKKRLVCVFDDRQKVVDMWRSKGITCLQVAPGSF